MKLTEAKELFKENYSDYEECHITPNDWFISTIKDQYVIVSKTAGNNASEWQTFIQTKRGEIRKFKTVDAACKAVREIGQSQVEVML